MISKRRELMMAQGRGRLPSEYQEVESITVNGKIVINSNRNSTTNSRMEIDFKKNDLNVGIFAGAGNSANTNRRFALGNDKGQWYWGVMSKNIYLGTVDYLRHTIYIDHYQKVFGIDDTQYTYAEYSTGDPLVSLVPIFFCGNNNGSNWQTAQQTLYSIKIYESGILFADYVPCYRKSDTTIGLYDIIGDRFLTKTNGDGYFTKGADVN